MSWHCRRVWHVVVKPYSKGRREIAFSAMACTTRSAMAMTCVPPPTHHLSIAKIIGVAVIFDPGRHHFGIQSATIQSMHLETVSQTGVHRDENVSCRSETRLPVLDDFRVRHSSVSHLPDYGCSQSLLRRTKLLRPLVNSARFRLSGSRSWTRPVRFRLSGLRTWIAYKK